MKRYESAKIEGHCHKQDISFMRINAPEIAKDAKPGQFVMVYLDKGKHLLPRPISLFDVDNAGGIITLVFIVAGAGTKIMSEWPIGHTLQMLGPLGNGFNLDGFRAGERVALVGGGLGAAPLFFLVKSLNKTGIKTDIYLGFRCDTPMLIKHFESLSDNLHIVTEDDSGSGRYKGRVTDFLPDNPDYAGILSCGPTPMLKTLAAYAKAHKIPCQVSMEERMACGLGACKGCVVKTRAGYHLCCMDGPVFDSKEVKWDG